MPETKKIRIRMPRPCLLQALCGWLMLSLMLLAWGMPSHAQDKNSASAKYQVEITGVADPLASLLKEHLEIFRHQESPDLNQEELQRLVNITPQQIRDLLATEGYFSAAIESTLMVQGERPVARFHVAPGEPTRIGSVEIRFTGEIAQGPAADEQRMNRLRRQWGLKQGEIFRQRDWDGAKNGLLSNLLVRDFPAAKIAFSEAKIDPQSRTAALTVEADSGPAFTFDGLQIEGLQRYSRRIIDELNPIRPGDRYSQERLNELQTLLEDTGYFRSVFATIEVDPAKPRNVPVRVDVTENERRRLSLGIGFSTDSRARVQARWFDRNFLGQDWRLESELLVDRETQRIGGTVFLPSLRNGWRPSFDARLERTDISGEINDTIRFGGHLTSPNRYDEKIWGVSYLADRQRIGDTFTNNRQALIGSFTYTKRRLDNLLTPRRGYVASIELNAGPNGLINESNIGRVVASATSLEMFAQRWQTILRGQVGRVFWANRLNVPNDLLFRTGGDQTVRGYGYETIGVTQDGAIVGGTVLGVVSAELVYWIRPTWGAAIFHDAGDANDSWSDFNLKQGTGIGARWRSPIGPVNLDLAYAHETREPRIHFSIGYGF